MIEKIRIYVYFFSHTVLDPINGALEKGPFALLKGANTGSQKIFFGYEPFLINSRRKILLKITQNFEKGRHTTQKKNVYNSSTIISFLKKYDIQYKSKQVEH